MDLFLLLAADGTASTESASVFFKKLWTDIVTFFTTKYWNIILFLAILVVGVILIKTLLAIIKKGISRSHIEKIAQALIMNLLRFALYLVLVLVLLSVIGVQITGVVTALSAAILAVGMALKDNFANLANGLIIVSTHMFNKGDRISVGDTEGIVQDINFFFTTIFTNDNKKVMIPNSTLVNNPLSNFGTNGTRRVDFTFSTAYDSDVEKVKSVVLDVMRSYNKIKLDPEPFCRLKVMNASSLDFFSYCWCLSDDYWDVYYYVTENVFNEFKRNGIGVPYNQAEVRLRTDDVVLPVDGDKLPARGEELPAPPPPREPFPYNVVTEINKLKEKDKQKQQQKKNKQPKTEK